MRILVTGATGFLGFKVCEVLKKDFANIIGTGRNEIKGKELEKKHITFIKADLSDIKKMASVVECVDYIVHCGGLSSPWGRKKEFLEINYKASEHLAQLARKNQIKKFIFISSPSVYHSSKDLINIEETHPVASNPLNYYIDSKIKAEESVFKFFPNAIILRPRAIFGPGEESIFPRLIRAHENGKLRTIGDGENLTDLTYIDNAVEAIKCALLSGKSAEGNIFNITDGGPKKLWDILDYAFLKLGLSRDFRPIPYRFVYTFSYFSEVLHKVFLPQKEPVLTRYTCNLLAKSQTLNISKARRLLGYSPKTKTMEGIEKFIEYYKNNV